jgi:hypothetical protein
VALVESPGEVGLGPVLKRARYLRRLSGEASGEKAHLSDLTDCLPREEAIEALSLAGLHDLMQHFRPAFRSSPLSSMFG